MFVQIPEKFGILNIIYRNKKYAERNPQRKNNSKGEK